MRSPASRGSPRRPSSTGFPWTGSTWYHRRRGGADTGRREEKRRDDRVIERPSERFDSIARSYDLLARTTSADRYTEVLDAVPRGTNRALDAGCGSGVLAARLAHDVRHVVGIDVSAEMLALARRRGAGNVSFLIADMEQPSFPDRSFDLVISCNALHATRLEVSLPALRRLVRPGGRIVIVDVVSSWPRLNRTRAWRLCSAIVAAPGFLRRYGGRAAWRLSAYRMRRAWRGPWARELLLTPAAFRETCSRWLPGSRITRRRRGAMAAIWDTP